MSLTRSRIVNPPPTYLTTYRVTTTAGTITLSAYSLAHALRSAQELLGGTILSCLQQGDW